jgi:hypothetical protein
MRVPVAFLHPPASPRRDRTGLLPRPRETTDERRARSAASGRGRSREVDRSAYNERAGGSAGRRETQSDRQPRHTAVRANQVVSEQSFQRNVFSIHQARPDGVNPAPPVDRLVAARRAIPQPHPAEAGACPPRWFRRSPAGVTGWWCREDADVGASARPAKAGGGRARSLPTTPSFLTHTHRARLGATAAGEPLAAGARQPRATRRPPAKGFARSTGGAQREDRQRDASIHSSRT